MTTVGFIGSGHVGGTVARLAVAAGYDVVVSNSRGPDTLAGLGAGTGPPARAGAGPVAGKAVIDTNNYYPGRDGQISALDEGSTTSSELLQEHLPTSRIVKVFNNIYWETLRSLARPAGAPDRSALAIAGDAADAKARVPGFLDAIGYDAVDAGPLADGRRYQPDTPAYGGIYAENGALQNAIPGD